MNETRRAQAVRAQLDQVAYEYCEAKEAFEEAQVIYDTAREKLSTIKRLAVGMLTSMDWWEWQSAHTNVRYAAMPLGEAIQSVLKDHAWRRAWEYIEAQNPAKVYGPSMALDEITNELQAGGYDFRSSTPRREVNAALINSPGVTKDAFNRYASDEAAATLKMAQDLQEQFAVKKEPTIE